MGRVPVAALAAVLLLCSCATDRGEAADRGPGTFQPKPLDDAWSTWIVGEWQGSLDGDTGQGWSVTIEPALNGQFLICRSEAELTNMPPDQIRYLKEHMHATDEAIERFRSKPFREIELYTIDPQSGDVFGFLFDSLRCVAQGRGRREGSKEIMEWRWSVCGQGVSTRVTERVGGDECRITQKDIAPDGTVSEAGCRMTRKAVGR